MIARMRTHPYALKSSAYGTQPQRMAFKLHIAHLRQELLGSHEVVACERGFVP